MDSRNQPKVLLAFAGALACLALPGWVAAAQDLGSGDRTNSWVLPGHFSGPKPLCFLEARIAGERPLNLILDTGASYLVLSEPLAERLRKTGASRPVGRRRVNSGSGRRPKLDFVEVTNFQCGPLELSNTIAVVADLAPFSRAMGEPIDGIAGLALFGTQTLVMDFPARQVRLQPSLQSEGVGVMMAIDAKDGLLRVRVECAGEQFNLGIDSGSNAGFDLPMKGRHLPFRIPPTVVGSVANLGKISDEKAGRLTADISWGGLTFERPIVHAAPTESGAIGLEVLRHFVVKLDLGQDRLWLKPATNGPVTSPSIRSPGLTWLPGDENHSVKVVTVIPNTDAARAGLRPGSRITTINGEPSAAWTVRRWHELIDSADEVALGVLEGRKIRQLKLRIEVIVE